MTVLDTPSNSQTIGPNCVQMQTRSNSNSLHMEMEHHSSNETRSVSMQMYLEKPSNGKKILPIERERSYSDPSGLAEKITPDKPSCASPSIPSQMSVNEDYYDLPIVIIPIERTQMSHTPKSKSLVVSNGIIEQVHHTQNCKSMSVADERVWEILIEHGFYSRKWLVSVNGKTNRK